MGSAAAFLSSRPRRRSDGDLARGGARPRADGGRVAADGGREFCADGAVEAAAEVGAVTGRRPSECDHGRARGGDRFADPGRDGSTVVSLDRHTGEERWRSLSSDKPGYCPPSQVTLGGRQQVLVWHGEALAGLNPSKYCIDIGLDWIDIKSD